MSFSVRTANTLACLAMLVLPAVSAVPVRAADSDQKSDKLATQAQSLLTSRCGKCHGEQNREGGLRFLSRRDLITRNDSGDPAIDLAHPDRSELLRRVTSRDEADQMPPEGERLTQAEVRLLREWIQAGVTWPAADSSSRHWAYQPVVRPSLPAVQRQAWIRNEIDRFILAKLEQHKIVPAQPAEPARLLRRVYLDLIGLPPNPSQVAAFEADPSDQHYQRIVDQLLSSPRYGERWAQHWLDLARYADSNGYQADQFREMWAYRDWVIDALNNDMPFDQFTIEQLAGDLLPNATLDQKIATGFHRCTTCNVEAGVDPEENRVNQIFDRVNTTGTVWLGTTLECAQCHNHKYDPFTQQDYYQLFSFFNNTPLEVEQQGKSVTFEFYGPKMNVGLDTAQQSRYERLKTQLDQLREQHQIAQETLQQDFDARIAELRETLQQTRWQDVQWLAMESSGGAKLRRLDDNSILVSGQRPDKDTYTLQLQVPPMSLAAISLSALTHPSLPGSGPGRHDPERPNFVLNEFSVTASSTPGDKAGKLLELSTATADFSQANFDVAGAVDGDLKTAWAINPQFGQPHTAVFGLAERANFDQPTTLTLKLVQNHGGCRTIGCLHVQVSSSDPAALALPPSLQRLLTGTSKKLAPSQRKQLMDFLTRHDTRIQQLQRQIAAAEQQLKSIEPPTTLVMVELNQNRPTHIMQRGDFLSPGADVTCDTPEVLPPMSDELPRDRLGLAQWLVSRDNPLTARVAVNRWWARFFGAGLVASVEDFGTQADPPTHPELLDWLAAEFMEQGWSIKQLHRTIVLSATYRQDSRITSEQYQLDPYNRLYARGPRIRMPAEMIRDAALTASGLLSDKMHGPPVYPPQPSNIWRHIGRNAPKYATSTGTDRFRRGVYVVWRRSAPYASFVNFDAPDRAACVVKRSRTNTPLQALNLLNDQAYLEMARALGKRIIAESPGGSVEEQVAYGFRLCLARAPNAVELEHLCAVVESETERLKREPEKAQALLALKNEAPTNARQAAWTIVANILLNLDESITK